VVRVRFGTDGIRGVANEELTPELVMAVGRATARVLGATGFLVGRDTRRSGPLLQAAVSAGLASEGAEVTDVGVLPTPGVAFLSERRHRPAVVVSASHNPFADNGIKVFAAGGTKLSEPVERAIASEVGTVWAAGWSTGAGRPTGSGVGSITADLGAPDEYREHLRSVLAGRRLDGLSIALDCANGAASGLAPGLFSSFGAEVVAVGCDPDGVNINDASGSTRPELLARTVVDRRCDLGLAFDGDADRMVAVDHTGAVADGDVLLALFALDLAERDLLPARTVVVTVMTNLGFSLAMAERGITVAQTPVGDRHVLAALDAGGLALGGEQSGHLVFRRLATTGDGMLSGLLLADLVARQGRPLAQLADGLVPRVPQVLENVRVADPGHLGAAAGVWAAVKEVEAELGGTGRVLLRASGTEPLVRVMVEAPTDAQATDAARRLRAAVEEALGPAPAGGR